MNKELMKKQLEELKLKATELENELNKEEEVKTPFDRVRKEDLYYYVSTTGDVMTAIDFGNTFNRNHVFYNNYFNDEKVAEECAEYLKGCLQKFKDSYGKEKTLYLKCTGSLFYSSLISIDKLYKVIEVNDDMYKITTNDCFETLVVPLNGDVWKFEIVGGE